MKSLYAALFSLFAASALDAHAVNIDLSSSQTSVSQGDLVFIAVSVQDLAAGSAPSLGVYDLELRFNPDWFGYRGVAWGDSSSGNQLNLTGGGTINSIEEGAGSLKVFELALDDASLLDASQLADFTLFTAIFQALEWGAGSASGQFSIANHLLGDAQGNALTVDSLGSVEVMVNSHEVPEPTSALLLLGLLSMVALRSRLQEKL